MSTEEVYIRSFVTAGALASAVAFLVIAIGLLGRKRLGKTGLGMVGGVSLALAWVTAHIVMRGPPLGDLAHSMEAWRTLVWPPDVTRRFPALVAIGCSAGVIAHLLPRKGIARWVVAWIAMSMILWSLTEAMRRNGANPVSMGAFSLAFALIQIAIWARIEKAAERDSGMLLACGLMVIVIGTGIIQLVIRNYALGLVVLAGVVPIAILGVCSRTHLGVMLGSVVPATVTTMLAIAFLSGFLSGEPVAAFGMAPVLVGPVVLEPRFLPDLSRRRAWWNGWLARYGLLVGLVVAGVAIAVGWVGP